jgi:DNA-binding NtrC family response regulator
MHLPSLRERREDIPALVRHFIERIAIGEARPLRDITQGAMEMLKNRKWPGNVREMENALHRAMVMAEGDAIDVRDFSILPVGQAESGVVSTAHKAVHRTLAEIEAEAIQNALIFCNGNMTQAASLLGIAKSTLYRKVQPPG